MTRPPETLMACPVMKLASRVARKATSAATSAGRAGRRKGIRRMKEFQPSAEPPDPADRPGLTKFIQTFKKHLEAPSEDGFGYRVDLDLRPEGRMGALVNPLEAALEYYESFGADWERQALIRLRHVAGPEATGRAFERQVAPFVYRQLIDPGSIGAIRDMKLRIETAKRLVK